VTGAASSVVLTTPVQDASAWTGARLRAGPEDWVWNLAPATLSEIDRALASVKQAGRLLESVTRDDFALPSLSWTKYVASISARLHAPTNSA
jgi:hypothetical protein